MTIALMLLSAVLWLPAPTSRLVPAHREGPDSAKQASASRRPLTVPGPVTEVLRRIRDRVGDSGVGGPSLDTAWTLDLLAGCLRAGLPTASALAAVAQTVDEGTAEPLMATSARLGLWAPDPWEPMAATVQFAEAAALARRSGSSGAPLAQGFADLAERARADVADQAEATAQRAGVLISAPLGLCFLPAFVFLGLVPVIVGLAGPMFGGMT